MNFLPILQVTLRAHCKGTQHIRKALQKKMEWKKEQKRKRDAEGGGKEKYTTLFQWLDSATSEAVVGLLLSCSPAPAAR